MYAIPIRPETIDLITLLNDGVQPELETAPTVFVIRENEPNEIVFTIDFVARLYGPKPTEIVILHQ